MIAPKYDVSLLYVEDEQGIRESVYRSLSLLTKKVTAVANGLEAIEYLDSDHIDLIITDIRMPKMDGITLIEQLRKNNIKTPIIITSAFNDTEYLLKAIDLKVDKFINKPIHINELLDTISDIADTITNKHLLTIHQQELNRYKTAVEQAMYEIKLDSQGVILYKNALVNQFLESEEEFQKHFTDIQKLIGEQESAKLLATTSQFKIFNKTLSIKLLNKYFTVILTAFASIINDDKVDEITILFHDITPVIKAKDQMIENLYTDKFTGLPNRTKLFHDLQKKEKEHSLFVIDIENFSKLNQLYGFQSGDKILLQMRDILLEFCLHTYPLTLYRNDADRFVILTNKLNKENSKEAEKLASQILTRIKHYPFEIGDNLQIKIDVTIGSSYVGEQDLLSEALMSLDVAKTEKKSFLCFDKLTDLRSKINYNLQIQSKIKTAIDENLLINYYQPIVDHQGKLVKYEALIRMKDPDDHNHVLTPFHFLDIAKQSKNYPLITRTVFKNAFEHFGDGKVPFSINLSYDDISNPDTTLYLEKLYQEYPNANVTLEILESDSLKDIKETLQFFHWMKNLGAKIAIDDFGSGYSNFAYFLDMPIDILKIDGSVVKRIKEYRGYLSLETIVRFAHNLGIETVAEFVEDEIIFTKLKELGVEMYQGYYFAQPKPYEDL